MSEQGSGPVEQQRRYQMLVLVLVLATLVEWGLYADRAAFGLTRDALVVIYLATSCAKFAAAVAFFMRFGTEVGWRMKAQAVLLVLCGGTFLALRLLLSAPS